MENYTKTQKKQFFENLTFTCEFLGIKLTDFGSSVRNYPDECSDGFNSIKGATEMPSYATLNRIIKNEALSESTVNDVVDFYNLNIEPEISAWDFFSPSFINFHRKRRNRESEDDGSGIRCKLFGVYKCYYPSKTGNLSYGVLILCDDKNGGIKAHFIDCIKYKNDLEKIILNNKNLEDLNINKFKIIKSELGKKEFSCFYYVGNAVLNGTSINVILNSLSDKHPRSISMFFDIAKLLDKYYFLEKINCALVYSVKPDPTSHNRRSYNMGIVDIDCKANLEPIADSIILDKLELKTDDKGYSVFFDEFQNREWKDFILDNTPEGA